MSEQPDQPIVSNKRRRVRAVPPKCAPDPAFELDNLTSDIENLFSQYSSIVLEAFLRGDNVDISKHTKVFLSMLASLERIQILQDDQQELPTTQEVSSDEDLNEHTQYDLWGYPQTAFRYSPDSDSDQ